MYSVFIKSKPFSYWNLMKILLINFEKYSSMKLMEIHQVDGVIFHEDGRTSRRRVCWSDKQTNMTNLTVAFRNFVNPSGNVFPRYCYQYPQLTPRIPKSHEHPISTKEDP